MGSDASTAVLPVPGLLDQGRPVTLPIAALLPADSPRTDGEDAEHIRALAEIEGKTPPIIVHRSTMRIIDGMHRLKAARLRGLDTIEVYFFDGDERDLFVLAVELNSTNGLPLSHTDRTSAARRVIESYPQWSDRTIAQVTGLSAKTVGAIRRRSTADVPQLNGRIGRDGKVRPLTAKHGRQLASRLMMERPNASLREIAREAGVSVGTAQDVRRRLHLGEDPVPPRQRTAEPVIPARREVPVDERIVVPGAREAADRLLPTLKGDPSLRFSEVGRTVLRLLDIHSISGSAWVRLANAVPAHCADAVGAVARSCAESWLQFAEQVEKRGGEPC